MYYCKHCKSLFDEDQIVSVDESFSTECWGSSVTCPCSSSCCPYCGDDDIEEAPKCDECGEYFVPGETYEDLCEECREKEYEEDED